MCLLLALVVALPVAIVPIVKSAVVLPPRVLVLDVLAVVKVVARSM